MYLILQRNEKAEIRLLEFELFSEQYALNWSTFTVLPFLTVLPFTLCLKVVVVIAAGVALAETNTDHLSARSIGSSWRTCPVAAAGKTSRYCVPEAYKGKIGINQYLLSMRSLTVKADWGNI